MMAYWDAADAEANEFKDSSLAVTRLCELYRKLDGQERAMADQVLSEWILSDHPTRQYDAKTLVRRFGIVQAIPALRTLAQRLATSRAPRASADLENVNRPIAELARDDAAGG